MIQWNWNSLWFKCRGSILLRDCEDKSQGNFPSYAGKIDEATEHKGNLLIRDLWQNGTASVHNMRVVNTDAKYHLEKTPEKCLHEAERAKKKMYLEACHQQCQHFSAFIDSVDRLMGVEATATLKRIASRLATKWRQPYSRTWGYVKSTVAINLVRATHRCIRGSMVPDHKIRVQRLQ